MQKTSLTVLSLFLFSTQLGCSGPATDDAGGEVDGGPAIDTGRADGGPLVDTGPVPSDSGAVPDVPVDTGPLADGAACSASIQCLSAHCVDGVCCESACTGTCQACAAASTGDLDGRCAPVLAIDPDDECDPSECRTGACGATGCELQPSTHVCRDVSGVCDAPETCSGTDEACPADAMLPESTVCRSPAGVCDVAEACDGSTPTCPSDALASASTPCRASAGTCDVTESCTGFDALCPTDAFAPATAPLCGPYDCSGGAACLTTCSLQTDCSAGNVCQAGVCQLGYRIFVTAARFAPNFGGVANADARCQAAAMAAGVPGTFRAWISDSTRSAASRLHHSLSPYYRLDGTTPRIIASDWNDLVDGVTVAIATDEFGAPHRDEAVWTGSLDNGAASAATCSNWTSGAGATLGMSGNSSAAAFSTYYGAVSCASSSHLYCVEQPPPG
jgi:hypothetical protein